MSGAGFWTDSEFGDLRCFEELEGQEGRNRKNDCIEKPGVSIV